jgi:hypothetical protein
MKFILIALLASVALSGAVNNANTFTVALAFTNSTTAALSTCTATGKIGWTTPNAAAGNFQVWGLWQASSTAPAANDMGVWCGGAIPTTPFYIATVSCYVVTLGTGAITAATLVGTGTALTTVTVTATTASASSFTYLVNLGTFNLHWNTTLSAGKTLAAYGDSSTTTTAPSIPTTATGFATAITGFSSTDGGCFTAYTTWAVKSGSVESVSILSGLISLAFF